MSIDKDDWRLQGQESYLTNAKLVKRDYRIYREDWEHDHCAFCGVKFCENDESCERDGYATEDDYYWICNQCFADFQKQFGFSVVVSDKDMRPISDKDDE